MLQALQRPGDRPREFPRVTGLEEEPALPIPHELLHGLNAGGHAEPLGGHGLEQGHGQALAQGGEDEEV